MNTPAPLTRVEVLQLIAEVYDKALTKLGYQCPTLAPSYDAASGEPLLDKNHPLALAIVRMVAEDLPIAHGPENAGDDDLMALADDFETWAKVLMKVAKALDAKAAAMHAEESETE